MTKARNGLDRMLTRAQIREETAQRGLAERVRESETQHAAKLRREAELREAQSRQLRARNAASFQRSRIALAATARAVDDAALAARAADDLVRAAQQQLLDRSRERKTLERLDERNREQLAADAARAAQRSLDDFGNRRRTQP